MNEYNPAAQECPANGCAWTKRAGDDGICLCRRLGEGPFKSSNPAAQAPTEQELAEAQEIVRLWPPPYFRAALVEQIATAPTPSRADSRAEAEAENAALREALEKIVKESGSKRTSSNALAWCVKTASAALYSTTAGSELLRRARDFVLNEEIERREIVDQQRDELCAQLASLQQELAQTTDRLQNERDASQQEVERLNACNGALQQENRMLRESSANMHASVIALSDDIHVRQQHSSRITKALEGCTEALRDVRLTVISFAPVDQGTVDRALSAAKAALKSHNPMSENTQE